MAKVEDLVGEIFDGQRSGLAVEFEGWMRGSRRCLAFAELYRSKIRSKLRQAGSREQLGDVRAELETAALLLSDRRFEVAYETYAALKQRGPDFTVTYRVNTTFNVEVRRVRGDGTRMNREGTDFSGDGGSGMGKLVGVVCEKVSQMPPSVANLLWLVVEGEWGGLEIGDWKLEMGEVVGVLRRMAERKEEDFFRRRGFRDAASFLKQLNRLSGIVVRREEGQVVWLNPAARHGVGGEVGRGIEGLEIGEL